MPFTLEQKNKLIDTLKAKGVRNGCPLCRNKEWVIGDEYVVLLPQEMLPDGGFVLGGPTIPVIPLLCKQCGYVAMLSSKILANLPPEGKV